jgi:hypothetical protein
MKPDRIWWTTATLLVAAGLVLLPVTDRSVPAAPPSAAAGILVLTVSCTVRMASSRGWTVVRRALGDALLAMVFTLALQGWVAFAGPLPAVGAVVLLAASSPPLVWSLRRLRRHGPGARVDRGERDAAPAPMPSMRPRDVASMSTADIGASWRRTARELPRIREPHRRAQLAELRRLYLDELERRDHAGFRSWLNAGPHAAHDPTRYIDPGAPPDLAY